MNNGSHSYIFYFMLVLALQQNIFAQKNKYQYEPNFFKNKTELILRKISPVAKDEFETNEEFEIRSKDQKILIEKINSNFEIETIENIKITQNRPLGKMRKYDPEKYIFRIAAYISGEWMVSKWDLKYSNLKINKKLSDFSNWGGVFYKGQYEMFFGFIIPPNQAREINSNLSKYKISFNYIPRIEVTNSPDGSFKVVYTILSYRLINNNGKIIAEHE